MEVALRNSPRDVDKAGGHGLSHNPKIMLDMKIPLEPNLFWKSCLGPAEQRGGAGGRRSHWEGGGVAGGSSGKRADSSVDGGVWPVPPALLGAP